MPGYHDASSTGYDEDCKALLFARWTAAAPVIVIRSQPLPNNGIRDEQP